jgi:hypothetical protein
MTHPQIKPLMAEIGYDGDVHDEGLGLFGDVLRYGKPALQDKPAQAAATLNAWDEKGFRFIRLCLQRSFSKQVEFLFENLEPSAVPMEAVFGVGTLVRRIRAMQSGPERKPFRKEDKAALELLAKRGYGDELWSQLESLVEEAKRLGDDSGAKGLTPTEFEEQRLARLVALHAWFQEWSELARMTLKRREHLIRAGLAKKKGAGVVDDDDDTPDEEDDEPTPAPAPAPTPVIRPTS